jgi:hypothetical protein
MKIAGRAELQTSIFDIRMHLISFDSVQYTNMYCILLFIFHNAFITPARMHGREANDFPDTQYLSYNYEMNMSCQLRYHK